MNRYRVLAYPATLFGFSVTVAVMALAVAICWVLIFPDGVFQCPSGRANQHRVRKPVDFAEFAETVARLGMYGLATNEPPTER